MVHRHRRPSGVHLTCSHHVCRLDLVRHNLLLCRSGANDKFCSFGIFYDTIYGCLDRGDDEKAGIKSTALLFGDNLRPILAGFALTFVLCMIAAGLRNGNGPWYFGLSCGGVAASLLWQLVTLDVTDNANIIGKCKVRVSSRVELCVFIELIVVFRRT